ncbi:MAG TPA: alpha-galactosidase [bacterium]|nr:alpha-galactosidase [bacterium]
MIRHDPRSRTFQLEGQGFSYLLGVSPRKDLHHLHWGVPLSPKAKRALLSDWEKRALEDEHHISREFQRREFPDFGHNDLRTPAFLLEHTDGTRVSEFLYDSFKVLPGKPDFGPGPASRSKTGDQAQTLKIVLVDQLQKLELDLYYTFYPSYGLLVRRTILRNQGRKPVDILKLASASLDLPPGPWNLVRFPGKWAGERQMKDGPLQEGTVRLESRRGISSHEMNPFAMVTRGETSEEKGEVFALAPVTSGNWLIEAELFRDRSLRMTVGLNDFGFKWRLEPGKAFVTPESLLAYSGDGFSNLSLRLHRFVKDRVLGGHWQKRPRPMLINNWEATYFKFDQEKLLKIAKAGKDAGLELFVLDDGWFGKRNDDTTSLGDWTVDRRKLPEGLGGLSERIHGMGLKFGLWIEPEMVSPKSLLYKKHPDWCLHAPGRVRRGSRSQLVLDMGRPEVRDHLFKVLTAALEEAKVDYVKWDMNRSLSEVHSAALPPDRQSEVYFRYVMGVYDLMDRLNRRFPRVLFEGCSGGGARFDLGVLNYHPQIWTSDNTDGLDRLKIQYATSFAYPPLVMGAHVSSVPNHFTHRSLPLKWRALVAMSGNFGVEADLTKWSKKDLKELAGYISLYREIRPLVQFGDFYRLESPFAGPRASWLFVSPERSQALLFIFQTEPWKRGTKVPPVRLRGLAPLRHYSIEGAGKFKGDRLMEVGFLPAPFRSPSQKFICGLYHLKG